jgi:hypothetical protein
MLFCNSSKVNKLVFLKRKLYLVFLRLFKTALINPTKHSIVLLYTLIISKKVNIINKPYKIYF